MQKSRGVVTGRIYINNIKKSKIDEFFSALTKSVRYDEMKVVIREGKNHTNSIEFDARYGPVAGGWRSDVLRHVQNALVKCGSTATCTLRNYERIALPR